MNKKGLNRLATSLWLGNLVLILLLAGGWYLFNSAFPARAGEVEANPAPILMATHPPTWTPKPSITPVPPPTQRPTITPWPTPSPGPSLTPWVTPPGNVREIGRSVEDRPLEIIRFGNGPVVKLIVAGTHGGYEHNTIELADEIIAYLIDHPERLPAKSTLYILRSLNPDGYDRDLGVEGRANANNVDLNHNFPYNWKPDWSRDGCWVYRPTTAGTGPGSEPEVQALINFIDEIKPAALISYHSAGLGIFPGGRPDFPDSILLAEAIAPVTTYPYPPINTGCDYTGNLTDWASNTHQIPSVDIELTNHTDTDFDMNLRVLQVFLDWQ